jgi:hypothetical protein
MCTLKTCEAVTLDMFLTRPVTMIAYKPACYLSLVDKVNFPSSSSNCIESVGMLVPSAILTVYAMPPHSPTDSAQLI